MEAQVACAECDAEFCSMSARVGNTEGYSEYSARVRATVNHGPLCEQRLYKPETRANEH